MKFKVAILLLMLSCGQSDYKPPTIANVDTTVDPYLKVFKDPVTIYLKDPSLFTRIKYDFYKDSSGKIFWCRLFEGGLDSIYIDYTTYFCKHGSKEKIYFEDFIDIGSYEELDSCSYSIDNNHVFYFQACSCGGHFHIVDGADPKTFRRLSANEGADNNHFYFKTERRIKDKRNSKV